MDRAGATISDAPMVDGAGRSPCAGLTFTENAIIDPGNTIILNGRIAILICSLYEQCHSFVVRKKGSYRKNKPFCLLAVAALFFVQSYLNDIAHRGSITTHLYKERPAANGCRPENFIFFHCPLDGVRFSETFRYYRLMHVYTRVGLTLLQYNCRVKHVNQACFIRSRQKHNSGTAINTIQELSHQRNKADLLQSALSKNSIFC